LLLDLYLPAETAGAPVVLYLHGGGWILGTRDETPERLRALAEAGAVVASIDYTLAQDAPYPAQLDDIVAAGDWLARWARERGIDASRQTLAGASAGAQLALLTAIELCETPPARQPDGWQVGAAVGYFGNYDMTSGRPTIDPSLAGTSPPPLSMDPAILAPFGGVFPPSPVRQALLAGVPVDDLDDACLQRLSPSHRLHGGAPPMLLLHGGKDSVAPVEQSRRMLARCREVGVAAELAVLDGAQHEGREFDSAETAGIVVRFLRAHGTNVESDTEGVSSR
jgi:acetyl esterase/lipase